VLGIRKDIASNAAGLRKGKDAHDLRDARELIAGFGSMFEQVLKSGLLPAKDAVGLDPNNVAAIIEDLTARGLTDEHAAALATGQPFRPRGGASNSSSPTARSFIPARR
jgi:hypothetical protein